jgi:hypothetical protein
MLQESVKTRKQRQTLVRNINRAFGPRRIRNTAKRLKPLKVSADFLDITNALGFLKPFTADGLSAYRRALTIPLHIRQFLTLAFRIAILREPYPMPLRITIVVGKAEAAQLRVTDGIISIILTRSGPRRMDRQG